MKIRVDSQVVGEALQARFTERLSQTTGYTWSFEQPYMVLTGKKDELGVVELAETWKHAMQNTDGHDSEILFEFDAEESMNVVERFLFIVTLSGCRKKQPCQAQTTSA